MQIYAIFARLLVAVMLIIVWGLTDSPLSGVVFVLVLIALSAFRYRFKPYGWLIAAEIAVAAVFTFLWFPALMTLWLPAISFIEGKWREWEDELLSKDFEERTERIKLEKARRTAAARAVNAARLAEINERTRIAQDIHDHVGHEIAGALIAVQTIAKIQNDKNVAELLEQTVKRLESASESLRDTVHNLKPNRTTELMTLKELCDGFKFCEVSFASSGDLSSINWELLAANLKEALTNVSRHSDATHVTVKLNGNAGNVRMTITDNGSAIVPGVPKFKPGLGLSGMKERIRAAGGTLTVNTNGGFKLICVIPKERA